MMWYGSKLDELVGMPIHLLAFGDECQYLERLEDSTNRIPLCHSKPRMSLQLQVQKL
jgi:hypothetical protein